MIVETLRSEAVGNWTVTLVNSNYRPERRYVEVTAIGSDERGRSRWSVGFSGSPDEADMLFETVVRTIRLAETGDCESVDVLEIPDGLPVD